MVRSNFQTIHEDHITISHHGINRKRSKIWQLRVSSRQTMPSALISMTKVVYVFGDLQESNAQTSP